MVRLKSCPLSLTAAAAQVQLPEAVVTPAALLQPVVVGPMFLVVSLPVVSAPQPELLPVLPERAGAAWLTLRWAVPRRQPCLSFHQLRRCAETMRHLPVRLCPDGNEFRFSPGWQIGRRRNPH